jgi:hypothetical protein
MDDSEEMRALLSRVNAIVEEMPANEACLLLGGLCGVVLAHMSDGDLENWIEYVRKARRDHLAEIAGLRQ